MSIRRSPLPRRRQPIARSTTPIKKVNPDRQAKRRKSYAQKLAAYRRSATYKLVEARAYGECEATFPRMSLDGGAWIYKCAASRAKDYRLTHHHKTYARFGGKELPEDIIVLCDTHNEQAESQHPTRNRNYRRAS